VNKIFESDIVLIPFFFESPDRTNNASYKSSDTSETPTPVEYEGSNTVLVVIHMNSLIDE